ncbi:type I-E CRISPR-associated protein Cse2/CasB [Marinomonas sp. 15G1-11]|uniref:Type I-E CRISPR-associated protein Cse2/CasB n=1 Tax=Marinomonas phaeophyticola TaxID=3004091 RepID=A0ABT4JTE7_9GAMM|nr:type I-E CRISPR-associated protein Cse2/CasB [Marinomonas sp. 15G1-11]MCZ2721466.1 type I-E CRISPR-associated protein Cse2/CasB [Marinomonas sp. 15G1-11]
MDDQEFKVISRWWQSMFLDVSALKEKHIQPAPTAHKAELKRCDTADDVMLLEGFRALWMALLDNGLEETLLQMTKERQTQKLESWATVAAVLVHIKQDNGEKLAVQAGKKLDKQNKPTDKSIVSELRFAKLQNTPTPDDFLKRLRRIIQQLDGKVSPTKVAADILQWFDEHYDRQPRKADKRITVQWAMDYYLSANQKASKSTTTN